MDLDWIGTGYYIYDGLWIGLDSEKICVMSGMYFLKAE